MAHPLDDPLVAHLRLEVVVRKAAVLPSLNAFLILDLEAFVPFPRDW